VDVVKIVVQESFAKCIIQFKIDERCVGWRTVASGSCIKGYLTSGAMEDGPLCYDIETLRYAGFHLDDVLFFHRLRFGR
jgi:hypothetical protein